MEEIFRDFFNEVKPIEFEEPLAETLGAFKKEGAVLKYTFSDTVKMAGHACPTVAGAYLCCQKALEKLYPGEVPVRGEIAITVYGAPEEGVYGVIGQVFSFLTGAATSTGFKGLGFKFKRKDLLKFSSSLPDPEAMCYEFKRLDNGKSVLVRFYPGEIPAPPEKGRRIGELMEKALWGGAKAEEEREFRDLWMEKVKSIVLGQKEIDRWLKVEEKGGK